MNYPKTTMTRRIRLKIIGDSTYSIPTVSKEQSEAAEVYEKRRVIQKLITYLETTPISKMNWTVGDAPLIPTDPLVADSNDDSLSKTKKVRDVTFTDEQVRANLQQIELKLRGELRMREANDARLAAEDRKKSKHNKKENDE